MASELAEAFHVSRANITNLLHALSKKQLIYEVEDDRDRRRKIFKLTELGQQIVLDLQPMRHAANQKLFSRFTAQEKAQFLDFLERGLI